MIFFSDWPQTADEPILRAGGLVQQVQLGEGDDGGHEEGGGPVPGGRGHRDVGGDP